MPNKNDCDLAAKTCGACTKATPTLTDEQLAELRGQVPNWRLITSNVEGTNGTRKEKTWIERIFTFRTFAEAIAFLNCVAAIAEHEGHHPDFTLRGYRFVSVRLTTNAIQALSENDFIIAAKIDAIVDAPAA